MGKQQLYINGTAVDMPTEPIKLKVESNIFSDADKLMTAHSYSITLPRTMTNDALFALAYVAAADTGGVSTHTWLSCSLTIDGAPIFSNGRCVLTAVEDGGYKCNLFWGILGVIDQIKQDGLNLCDLPQSAGWNESTMANWITLQKADGSLPQYNSGMSNAIYDTLDTDSKALALSLPWVMPSVAAAVILAKIAAVYGVTIEQSTLATQRIQAIAHPLVTRKVMSKGETLTFTLSANAQKPLGETRYFVGISSNVADLDPNKTDVFNAAVDIANSTTEHYYGIGTLFARVKTTCNSIRVVGTCDQAFSVITADSPVTDTATLNTQTGLYELDKTYKGVTAEAGDPLLRVKSPSVGINYGWQTAEDAQIDVQMYVELGSAEDAKVGDGWCYERNYPEIEAIKYLGELLAHIGGCIVGTVTEPATLKITTFDEIMAEAPAILDTEGVGAVTMSLDRLAQKNVYKHKAYDDDGSDWEAAGFLPTEDTTLESERTAFDSKFKVAANGVRLWEVKKKDDDSGKYTASWAARGEYIAHYDNQHNAIVNSNQDFAGALADYYGNYAKLVRVPKVIDASVRLTVLELMGFDMAKPVYIPQLGRAYLVKTLESGEGEKYKIKMVQI